MIKEKRKKARISAACFFPFTLLHPALFKHRSCVRGVRSVTSGEVTEAYFSLGSLPFEDYLRTHHVLLGFFFLWENQGPEKLLKKSSG